MRKSGKTGHRHARRGARVVVFLRSGEQVRGKFLNFDDRYVRLEGLRPIPACDVRTLSEDRHSRRGAAGEVTT